MALTDNILAYWNLNDNGSGGVSLVDSTGNGYALTNLYPVTLGTGIIGGDAVFAGIDEQYLGPVTLGIQNSYTVGVWLKWAGFTGNGVNQIFYSSASELGAQFFFNESDNPGYVSLANYGLFPAQLETGIPIPTDGGWHYYVFTQDGSGNFTFYLDGVSVYTNTFTPGSTLPGYITGIGAESNDLTQAFNGQIDEVGTWSRALSLEEVGDLYNGGAGLTYPFVFILYYNNAESDGDWGNILNWWQDSGFTIQATALPKSASNPVNLYSGVTQNTQGSNQCFCYSADFWSANFGAGLTLQSTGVVNMQGTSVFSGTATDGVSMHDSSQLSVTSVVDGNAVMRDSSRAFGSILGNATIYYDGGNGQYPIGGTVVGSVTYLGWPAKSPQWFNDQATGGANDGDFANTDNWWTDNTYTTRPVNTEGTQELPDASTDVFIAPDIGIYANTGDAILVNSITANNGYISNITLTVSNGIVFSGNGNYGTTNSVIFADVTFSETAYNDHSAIHGNANYTSSASLVASFNHNSLGKLTSGASYGSNTMTVNIASGGGGGMISRLLNLPWFINI